MFEVTREIDFCYGHRLLNYDGKCRYLHGHNGRAVITLEAESLDERGMVLDFSDIKQVVSQWIDDTLDHRMILNRSDPAIPDRTTLHHTRRALRTRSDRRRRRAVTNARRLSRH